MLTGRAENFGGFEKSFVFYFSWNTLRKEASEAQVRRGWKERRCGGRILDRPPSSTVEQSLKEKNTFITPLSVHIQFRPPYNDDEEKQKKHFYAGLSSSILHCNSCKLNCYFWYLGIVEEKYVIYVIDFCPKSFKWTLFFRAPFGHFWIFRLQTRSTERKELEGLCSKYMR